MEWNFGIHHFFTLTVFIRYNLFERYWLKTELQQV
jgi:hypothetical protein